MSITNLLSPNEYEIYSRELTTITLTATNINIPNIVTSSAVVPANMILKGDTGVKTVKASGISIDGSDNVLGTGSLTMGSLVSTGNLLNTLVVPANTGASTIARLEDIPSSGTVVTSTNVITANYLAKGDTGARTVVGSGIAVDGSNNMSGVLSINGTLTNATNGCMNTYYSATMNRTFEGHVLANGTLFSEAGGVSVNKTGAGTYVITFTCSEINAPVACIADNNEWCFISVGHTLNTNTCTVVIREATTPFNPKDVAFNIVAPARV